MVVRNANINNIMKGMESTGGVRLHNHRRKLKQRFDIIRKLGQGTYGKVQLGINKETGQEVAIKTIKKAKIETEADLVRIRREIQIMSSVQHPNIIHIYEVFENREKMVLVMEYAAGGELYDYLNERKVLAEDEARRIFRQIATAVFYCHKHKICHRDLKLENILLDEQGSAKIADFGLSNVFDEQRLLNTFCGSPLYASPEIVKGTPYYGPEVDCWSLGVLLYTLVYGAMPFDGSNFKRLVKQISQGDYFEPKKTSPASSLIREMLAVSPAKRASIEKVCSHWWVNEGYTESCLEIAEELAGQTPVRLDLLLSLAPNPTGVSTENIMQQGLTPIPAVPQSDLPVRSHSMGSLMDIDHLHNAPQKFVRKQSLFRNSGAPGSSGKRKLEEGASCSEVNLKEHVKESQLGKGYCEMYPNDEMNSQKAQSSAEIKLNEQKHLKQHSGDKEMEVEPIPSYSLGEATNAQVTEREPSGEDSNVPTQEKSSSKNSPAVGQCSSSAVTPVDSSLAPVSSTERESKKEIDLSIYRDKNTLAEGNSQKDMQTTHDTDNINKDSLRKTGAVFTDKDTDVCEKPTSKEPHKVIERRKEKQKKTGNSTETPDISKETRVLSNSDNVRSIDTSDIISAESNLSSTSRVPSRDDTEVLKSNVEISKEKTDKSQKSQVSNFNVAEPAVSLANNKEKNLKAAQSAENLNNISLKQEAKNATRDKPKRLFIPGVNVSDFKKAFERKLSSPEIFTTNFGKKPPTKSGQAVSDKTDDKINVCKGSETQKTARQGDIKPAVDSFNNSVNIQFAQSEVEKEAARGSSDIVKSNQTFVAPKSTDNASISASASHALNETKSAGSDLHKISDIAVDSTTKENVPNVIKVKSTKSAKDKMQLGASSELIGSLQGGIELKDAVQSPTNPMFSRSNATNSIVINDINKTNEKATESKPQPLEHSVNEETTQITNLPARSLENTGNKKRSKVEITLKSATLPRRKTSKAEIKLDPTLPPVEFKTEIEHMVSPPPRFPPPSTVPVKRTTDDKSAIGSTQSIRSWSLEPEGTLHQQVSAQECIIPVQIESSTSETPSLGSPTSGRPPAYPFQQRLLSQSHRNFPHQRSQESEDGEAEKIKKSPREYIIPISMEGGGYVTPRASSLEPSARDEKKFNSPSRSSHFRRMSSILSDTSEDEGLSVGPQRHGSISRDRDEGRNFHFHQLRSSRPLRHLLDRSDSLSSAEDDDDDDEGFEILTAESLFSTLLSRVRSLTQRLTVEDAKVSGLPPSHFVNQLSHMGSSSRPWKKFYDFHREPLSRRLSETSFSRLLSNDGDRESLNETGVSRESPVSSISSEPRSFRTLPRGSSNPKLNQCDATRRRTMGSFSPQQQSFGTARAVERQEGQVNSKFGTLSEPLARKSSSKNSISGESFGRYNNKASTSRKLFRTHSLRSDIEEKRFDDSQTDNKYQSQSLPKTSRTGHDVTASVKSNNSFSSAFSSQRNKLYSPPSHVRISASSSSMSKENTPLKFVRGSTPSLVDPNNTALNHDINYRTKRESSCPLVQTHQPPKHSSSLPRIAWGQKNVGQKSDSSAIPQSRTKQISKKISRGKNEELEDSELTRKSNDNTSYSNKSNDIKSDASRINEHVCSEILASAEEQSMNNQRITKENNLHIPESTSQQNDPILHVKSGSWKKSTQHSTSKASNAKASDLQSPQERRKSRFLRPDFFDTPPEESAYVKERVDKKAAEAELKKARRLSCTASLKEINSRGIRAQDDQGVRSTEHIKKNKSQSVLKQNRETSLHSSLSDDVDRNSDAKHPISQESAFQRGTSCDKSCSGKSPKRNNVGTLRKPDLSSRIERNALSVHGHDSCHLDMTTIATESTYLKRAVSVDDVSHLNKGSLSRSNSKVGEKISSVLRIFSKPKTQNSNSQHSFVRKNSNSENQFDPKKSLDAWGPASTQNNTSRKLKQSRSAHTISNENNVTAGIIKPSKCFAASKDDTKRIIQNVPNSSLHANNSSTDSQKCSSVTMQDSTKHSVQSDNTSISHEPTENKDLNDSKNQSVQQVGDSIHIHDRSPNSLCSSAISEGCDCTDSETCQVHCHQTLDISSFPDNSDEGVCGAQLNKSESVESSSAAENLSLNEDNEKDTESVEDRIRRKSFYSRFNDVKKKSRKKSPQFPKENKTSSGPRNYHKSQENLSLQTLNNPEEKNELPNEIVYPLENQIDKENTANPQKSFGGEAGVEENDTFQIKPSEIDKNALPHSSNDSSKTKAP